MFVCMTMYVESSIRFRSPLHQCGTVAPDDCLKVVRDNYVRGYHDDCVRVVHDVCVRVAPDDCVTVVSRYLCQGGTR